MATMQKMYVFSLFTLFCFVLQVLDYNSLRFSFSLLLLPSAFFVYLHDQILGFLINVSNIQVQIFFFFSFQIFLYFYHFVIIFFPFSVICFLRFFVQFFYKNITWKLLVNLPFLSHLLPYCVSFFFVFFFCSFFLKKCFIFFNFSPYCTLNLGEYR